MLNFPIIGDQPHAGSKAFRTAMGKATTDAEKATVIEESWHEKKYWCLTLRVYDLLMRPSLLHMPGTHARLIIDAHPNPRHATAGRHAVKEWNKVKLGYHQLERHTSYFQRVFGGCHLFVLSRMLFNVLSTVPAWVDGTTVPSGQAAKAQGPIETVEDEAKADYFLVSDHPSATTPSAVRRLYTALLQGRLLGNASDGLEFAFAARDTVLRAVIETFNGRATRLMRDVRSGALPLDVLKRMAEAKFGFSVGQAVYMSIAILAAQTFSSGGGGAWGRHRADPIMGGGGAALKAEVWECAHQGCATKVKGSRNHCSKHGVGKNIDLGKKTGVLGRPVVFPMKQQN